MRNFPAHVRRLSAAVCAFAMLAPGLATAQDACGLCDRQVVTNSDLAACFLKEYETIASGDDPVVVVDLSQCEASRALAEALPSPLQGDQPALEPDFQFMISRLQLACLKQKLEEPGLVLDPFAKIDLDSCG